MIEIRFAKDSDVNKLKELWKLCFGDEDSYIHFYYSTRFKKEETVVLLEDNHIAAMLTMLPLEFVLPNNQIYKSTMLYAIATHPNYRSKGFATQIIDYSNDYIRLNNQYLSVLVPATNQLFSFYYKHDYKDGFYIRECLLDSSALHCLYSQTPETCALTPVSPAEYNAIRNMTLTDKTYIKYSDEDIAYQKKLSNQTQADIYKLNFINTQGCVTIERLSSEKIFIKEIILDEKYTNSALKQISKAFQAKEYAIRTPSFLGFDLNGIIRPFAVYKTIKNTPNDFLANQQAYLGFAFD